MAIGPSAKASIVVAVVLAMGASACANRQDAAATPIATLPVIATSPGQGCEPSEELVFAGDVEDDFGLGIAVCRNAREDDDETIITVRYSGEGGSRSVSCVQGLCGGVIELTHYVRPRFTMLTLTWRDQNGMQRLVESFNAEDERADPVHHVTHYWSKADGLTSQTEIKGFPVRISTAPLSMLTLDPLD